MRATISETVSVGGLTLSETTTVVAEKAIIQEVSVPAGKVGTLSVRGSATAGTAALSTGHGITTAQIVDLYFTGGVRRGVTVGTVSGNNVPFTGGTGNDLPTLNDPITVCARSAVGFLVDGDKVAFLGLSGPAAARCTFAVKENGGSYPINQTQIGIWHWSANNGQANPLAGESDVETAYLTHDQTTAQTLSVSCLANN